MSFLDDMVGNWQRGVGNIGNAIGSIGNDVGQRLSKVTPQDVFQNSPLNGFFTAGGSHAPIPPSGGSADIQQSSAPMPNYSINSANPGRQGNDETLDPSMIPQQPQGDVSRLIGILQGQLNSDPYSSGPYMNAINKGYDNAYNSIESAKTNATNNAAVSTKNIQDMYQMGKNDTLAQGAGLQQNSDNLVNSINGIYGNTISGLQGDRTKEMQDRAALDQSLGIQAAGLGGAGNTQTQAIQNSQSQQQAAAKQAADYGAADQTANIGRANAFTAEGTARAGDLRTQLAGLIGQLDTKKADLGVQEAKDKTGATAQSYQDWLGRNSALLGQIDKLNTYAQNDRKIDANSRTQSAYITAMGRQGAAGNAPGTTNMDEANTYIKGVGGDPNAFSDAYTTALTKAANPANPAPSDAVILQGMQQANPKLPLAAALQYIKLNAKGNNQYNPGGGLSPGMMGIMNDTSSSPTGMANTAYGQ
jgi:hypothetical protein